MNRKGFGAVLDETVSKMEHDVRVLENRRVTLTVNTEELEKTRDSLSAEISDLEIENTKVIKETKDKVQSMTKTAQEKLDKATVTDTTASRKLSELNQKIKDSESIIKTNQGLKNTLGIQTGTVKTRLDKLSELVEIIKETIEEL